MIRSRTLLLTTIICFLVCLPCTGEETQAEFTQKILAVVNGEPITQTDVDEILAPIYLQYKSTYKGAELEDKLKVARADILEQLIGDKLILQLAKKEELVIDEKEVDALVNELRNNFKTIEEFDTVLKNQNVTLPDLRKRYKEQLLIKKAVSQEVLSKIVITPTQISDYYEKHSQEFITPEQVHLRDIFLSVDNNETDVEQKANTIYDQLKKGAEFVELVEKYSEAPNVIDSGDMGFMKRGSFREEIEKVVFTLGVGEFTKPLKTASGFYIFKVVEKKEATIPPIAAVQETIRNRLFGQEAAKKIKEWINKLKESALIEVKTDEKQKS